MSIRSIRVNGAIVYSTTLADLVGRIVFKPICLPGEFDSLLPLGRVLTHADCDMLEEWDFLPSYIATCVSATKEA